MTENKLPHWDMSVVYPSLESKEFQAGFQSAANKIDELAKLFDQYSIAKRDAAPLDDATVGIFESVVNAVNATIVHVQTLIVYINSFVTTDTRDTVAQAKLSEFQMHLVRLNQLGVRLSAWIGSLDVDALIAKSAVARDHAYFLRKAKIEAEHLMSPAEEELAAELQLTGSVAWNKLHSDVSSQLLVTFELDGKSESLPMSAIRNLAYDPNRDVRRRAYEAEIATWAGAAVPIAAAMNGIKGATNILSKRRKWGSPLDAAVFDNSIDRATLDAMMMAAREAFPDFRRYLRAKARALGLPVLAWYDLFAPLGNGGRTWTYDEGAQFIVEQFGTFSDKLSGMAARAFRENWIDAEPRLGKVDGAFCMSLRKDESRVLTNFKPVFGGVSTIAHELGHAYHNVNLAQRTMLQRETPMTLAETASIFCETIVTQAALKKADKQEQIVILENSLQNSCQVVVDISSRFIFEQSVFEKRMQRALSVDEFNELILRAQRETYGDGLDPEKLHPYMWAMKPHYYSSTFYNYPYMFGLLFGLGLYARYQSDPAKFKAGYDELLSSTGLGDAAELATRFEIDTRSPAFWRSSFDVIRRDVDRFDSLV
ncbi:MAG: M3 family oligoendopeptidase [Chloroflexi bacterium]|nr:M3 family oligoendopeptidase [Chloroflexota bacterium]